jgi:hypothetical protein
VSFILQSVASGNFAKTITFNRNQSRTVTTTERIEDAGTFDADIVLRMTSDRFGGPLWKALPVAMGTAAEAVS